MNYTWALGKALWAGTATLRATAPSNKGQSDVFVLVSPLLKPASNLPDFPPPPKFSYRYFLHIPGARPIPSCILELLSRKAAAI